MVAPILSFQKVSKSFGSVKILREVEFDVAPGQLLGLAGENGAGKTTLLKCMLDFCAFDGGAIEIKGMPSTRPAARACMTFLPLGISPAGSSFELACKFQVAHGMSSRCYRHSPISTSRPPALTNRSEPSPKV